MLGRELLKKIYNENSSSENLVFSHADKIWVMPSDAVKGAMDMYQPTSRAGKILKNKIIKKHKTPFFAREAKIEKANIGLNSEVKKQLEELLGISDFYAATYMGDTSTSQNDKAVLQIYAEDEIYAYVKVTTNKDNAKRFEKEAETLNTLKELGLENVPRVIGLDLDSEIKMFAQSTKKPMGQEVELVFDSKIMDTVKEIADKTKHNIDYKESDLYERVNFLKENLKSFDEEQQTIIEEAIKKIEEANIEEYSFYHGDFTPWNIYHNDEEIQIFDFEYCCKSMPSYMDVFHYITQMSLLGKRNTAQCAMMEYEKYFKMIEEYVPNPDILFTCYITWVISFYLERSYDNLDRIEDLLNTRVELLEYLVRYRKNQ